MDGQRDQLNHLRIASPCSADWDSMVGDERVRFCDQCSLHVYNISELSSEAAIALVTGTEGRLCTRFFRRSDGTILTKDCPIGLRAIRVRASRVATAVLSAIVALFSGTTTRATSGTYLQGEARYPINIKRTVKTNDQDATTSLTGTIYDSNRALISHATITLFNERTKKGQATNSNEEGTFRLEGLEAGEYTLTVESSGSRAFKTPLYLNSRELVRVEVTLINNK